MPLRSDTRVAVPLPLAAARPIVRNVPFARQFLTQWCWAACIAMVRSATVPTFKQCEAARLLITSPDPCAGSGSGCTGGPVLGDANPNPQSNRVAPQSRIAELWNKALNRTTVQQQGVISKSDLNAALAKGRGHAVQVLWALGPSKHVGLVVGRDGDDYLVHDPCEGELVLTYDEIEQVDGVRTWMATFVL